MQSNIGVIHRMWATYVLQVITAGIAFFQLAKDWTAHKHDWRRKTVFSLIVLLMLLSLYSTHRSAKNTADQHDKDVKRGIDQHNEDLQQISALNQSVQTANTNQVENTKVFVQQFADVSQQLTNLKTQVQTDELRRRVGQLQGKLDANIKAMAPGPKANLSWTFTNPNIGEIKSPNITETTVAKQGDTIHVEVNIRNQTQVNAIDANITIILCNGCRFIKDPNNFVHIGGAPQEMRALVHQNLLANTILETLALDFSVPSTSPGVKIGMSFRCQTCVIPDPQGSALTIRFK